jgi:hypothetical protein
MEEMIEVLTQIAKAAERLEVVTVGDFYYADRDGFIQTKSRTLGNFWLTWLDTDSLKGNKNL